MAIARWFGARLIAAAAMVSSALLLAVGVSYALGSVPVFMRLNRSVWLSAFIRPQWNQVARMLTYGWPLIIAFGASAAHVLARDDRSTSAALQPPAPHLRIRGTVYGSGADDANPETRRKDEDAGRFFIFFSLTGVREPR